MDHPSPDGLSAAAAIHAALAAEKEAMQAVAACHAQAEEIRDDARRRANTITAQADARISDIHKEYNERIRKREETIPIPDHRQPLPTDHPSMTALQTAVAQLAAWLTGEIDPLPPTQAPTQ